MALNFNGAVNVVKVKVCGHGVRNFMEPRNIVRRRRTMMKIKMKEVISCTWMNLSILVSVSSRSITKNVRLNILAAAIRSI